MKSRWSISFTKFSPMYYFLSFGKVTLQKCLLGYASFASYREDDDVNAIVYEAKDMFAILAAFLVCFGFGFVNSLFILFFWYMTTKQFEFDFYGGLHAASTDILLGASLLVLIFGFHFKNYILLVYPIMALVWSVRYIFSADSNLRVILLQLVKILIFVLSKYIPTVLLYNR